LELIRLLLLEKEQSVAPPGLGEYSNEDVLYNCVLMADAGLIVAELITEADVPEPVIIQGLTWLGHDFLAATRDSKVWKLAKAHFRKPAAPGLFPF
jgi:hypothetical protein